MMFLVTIYSPLPSFIVSDIGTLCSVRGALTGDNGAPKDPSPCRLAYCEMSLPHFSVTLSTMSVLQDQGGVQ